MKKKRRRSKRAGANSSSAWCLGLQFHNDAHRIPLVERDRIQLHVLEQELAHSALLRFVLGPGRHLFPGRPLQYHEQGRLSARRFKRAGHHQLRRGRWLRWWQSHGGLPVRQWVWHSWQYVPEICCIRSCRRKLLAYAAMHELCMAAARRGTSRQLLGCHWVSTVLCQSVWVGCRSWCHEGRDIERADQLWHWCHSRIWSLYRRLAIFMILPLNK